ncbi:MAG: hypothetical protein HOP15_17470 [Planctomycetes bacterium]|nr:hypothetical protein [Planctomycetota bacterium]
MARPAKKSVYIALTGDLVASKAMDPEERAELQRHVLVKLKERNRALDGDSLAAPLTLTAGDEIQGLFRHSDRLVETIQELTDYLFGVVPMGETGWRHFPYLVFGVGRGHLTTDSIPAAPKQASNPALLDGPAFHRARAALETAQRTRTWASFQGFGTPEDDVLSALFSLMGAVRSRWGPEQGATSYRVRRHELQKSLAKERGVSGSVVSESLSAAHHKTLLAGEEAARKLLARLESLRDG